MHFISKTTLVYHIHSVFYSQKKQQQKQFLPMVLFGVSSVTFRIGLINNWEYFAYR